jgi:hypothetical protein
MKWILPILFSVLVIIIAACLPIATQSTLPIQNDTSLPPTITPTGTTVWFPPTPTFTPLPSATLPITPTIDSRPLYGEIIFTDNFSVEENWITGNFNDGSIALGENEITLAVKQEKGYLFSLRQNIILDDYYAEITANPSICRGEDEYGLLIRVSPSLDFLRFSFTCNGQSRVDRIIQGQASSPQPPNFCGAVPPGAPSSVRMGILAKEKEIFFYADGKFIFNVSDPNLIQGNFGVFARSSTAEPVTINFSDLKVYEVIP